MKNLLIKIIKNNKLHSKWLNTLSLMENTGAKKISASEHPILVNELILKHAAEEARHAYYLKKQISKVGDGYCPDYTFPYLLAPMNSYQYLQNLDVHTARFVQDELQLKHNRLIHACYLLVTYAIEMRADELYPIYQDALTESNSSVNVKSIIAEETGHLEEMTNQLKSFSEHWEDYANLICLKENALFETWMVAIKNDVDNTYLKSHTHIQSMTGSI